MSDTIHGACCVLRAEHCVYSALLQILDGASTYHGTDEIQLFELVVTPVSCQLVAFLRVIRVEHQGDAIVSCRVRDNCAQAGDNI